MKEKQCCPQMTLALEKGYVQKPLLQFERNETELVKKEPELFIEAVLARPEKRKPKTVNLFFRCCMFCGKDLTQ